MFRPKIPDERFKDSKSQLGQDLLVLEKLSLKSNGYFVEFGATDGVNLSNTWLLENHFGWKGILAEPSQNWHSSLMQNRIAHITTDCVWSETGLELMFNQVDGPELSTIDAFSSCDLHSGRRRNGKKYLVKTISLLDLLEKYQAPTEIDYLSIDTEGSEYEILSAFNFDRYRIKIITCEHNYTPMRQKIFDLLVSHGYQRINENDSEFDDWYMKI